MTDLLFNRHRIKEPDHKEKEILNLLQQPGVEQRIQGLAATLNDTFAVQTKILVDIRPTATILDTHTGIHYVYDGAIAPFDFDALTTLILRQAQYPIEELDDSAYAMVSVKSVDPHRFVMAMQDFVKLFAIKRWKVLDLAISDEQELTRKVF